VISGVSPGDTVVAGPYKRIRELQDGDAVRPSEATTSPSAPVQGPGTEGP
jgi:hypothetical protein